LLKQAKHFILKKRKIVITGGPSTGKSTVIDELINRQYTCFEEVSRDITKKAREEGIEQLFLSDPLLFSRKLIEGRVKQYHDADQLDDNIIFFDRGIPDVNAYLKYSKQPIPEEFETITKAHPYDRLVFIMPPWDEIYTKDAERYENFNQAQLIHNKLVNYYKDLGYYLIFVPFGPVEKRVDYIIDSLEKHS
jgi:predicted ATPase